MLDITNLKRAFQPKLVAETLKSLPPVPTVLTGVVFSRKESYPFPYLGIEEVQEETGTVPLVRYGENPIELDSSERVITLVEPEPITLKKTIRPREIAGLQALTGQNLKTYSQNIIDRFRRRILTTISALCGQAIEGRLQHPIKTDVGTDVYEFQYGVIKTYTPSASWNSADAKPLRDLDSMLTELMKAGVGAPYVVLAGENAYRTLLEYLETKEGVIVANYTKIDEQAKVPYVEYFGFKIYKVADTYKTADGTVKPVIDPNAVYVLGELPWKLKFLSLDDIEYGSIAMPMLVKVVKDPMGKSLSIIAESKPFPIPRINAVIKATVVS
jgi:hypothetical protein